VPPHDEGLESARLVHHAEGRPGASAGGLIITQFDTIGLFWQRIALATTIGLGSYAVKQAAGSVTVMHDLIRYRTIFDADARANQGNVAGFEPGRRPR
jgi:hypothetical protein